MKFPKEHSSVIFSAVAGIGVVATAALAAKAGYQSAQRLELELPSELETKEKIRLVWRFYIPAATSATVTVACIVSAKKIDGTKTLAAQTALAVTQGAYSEYREAIVEELGEKKDQKILAKVAENHVASAPAIVAGEGKVLCCELFTGRYFESSMSDLDKAVNAINRKLNESDTATLDDLYYILGLQTTQISGQTGWESPRHMGLDISTVLTPDQKPCLAFAYSYVKSF